MQPYCNGRARIRSGQTGPIYTIEDYELDWELVDSSERQMGAEYHYQAVVEHPELGHLTWNLWEYPEGVENHSETDINGHTLISDFDYGLEHEPEDDDDHQQWYVDEVVSWFFKRYEHPAVRTPYESAEGGYQYIWGGPIDAREAIYEGFPDLPDSVAEAAVDVIEKQGTEWVPIPSDEDYEPVDEDEHVGDQQEPVGDEIGPLPEQAPGIAFFAQEDGVIDVDPTGILTGTDLSDISAFSEVISQACDDLLVALEGSNAYATIAEAARRYRRALMAEQRSLDLIFALGVRLESARARLQREIDSGDYPEMAVTAGEALDSVLALHGPMIFSTERGRLLLSNAEAYARTTEVTEEFKARARAFASAVNASKGLASESVREILTDVNADIGEGVHPERAAAVAGTANRNFLVTVAKAAISAAVAGATAAVVGTIGNAFTASVPGGLFAGAVTTGSNVAWEFLVNHHGLLSDLIATSGPDMSWLTPVLNWVGATRGQKSQ